jgi:tetratricopeptide (TPR) repeat protein
VSIVGQNLRRFVLSKEAWRFQAFLRSTAQSAHTRVTSELIDKHGREDSISRRLSQTLDTLPAKEQAVLAALSILPHRPGYFTVDEACVIADCSTSALEKLSDAGLIQTFDQNLLMIHQTVAEFATQLLRETSCYARMANYFSELVLTLNTQQISARMSVFVSALAAAEKTTLFNAYCTIANALFPLLEASGQYDLALQMLLKAGKAADTAVQRAVTLANLARIHLLHQHYELASETARQALSMIGELGNPNIRANCYYTLADAEWSLGNKKSSTEFAEKAIALLSVIDHPYTISLVGTLPSRLFTERLQQRSVKQWLSWMHQALKPKQINEQNCLMLSGLAFLKFQMGHGEQADEQVKQVIDIATTNDFRLARLTGLAFRAWIHHHLSLYGSSDEFALEVVSTDYVLVPDAVVMAHSILSLNAMARGEFSAAEMFAKSIQPFSSQRSARLLSLVVDVTLIRVKIAMGRLVEARENSNSLLHSATASHIKEITGIAHALLGLIETRECNLFEAERHLSRSRSWLMEQITGPWFTLFYRICRGEYLLASNQTEAAYQEFNKVFVTGKRVQCPEYQAKAFLGMARAASQKNEINSATKFATESKNLFSELGHVNASYAHEWLQLPRRTDLIHAPLVI